MIAIALALVDNECGAGKSDWKATPNLPASDKGRLSISPITHCLTDFGIAREIMMCISDHHLDCLASWRPTFSNSVETLSPHYCVGRAYPHRNGRGLLDIQAGRLQAAEW